LLTMCGGSFGFWFCVILLATSFASRNFRSENEKDNIWETNNQTNNQTINNKNHIVPYEKCGNITCIQLCCPLGDRLVENCNSSEFQYIFPIIYSIWKNSMQSENKKVNELFPLVVQNPCQKTISFYSYPDNYFKYMFSANSSLYLPYFDIYVESTSYCLAVVDQFDAFICLEDVYETIYKKWKGGTIAW